MNNTNSLALPSKLNTLRESLWASIGYALIGAIFFWPLIQRFDTHILASDVFAAPGKSDAYTFLWMHWWVTKSLLGGSSFYFCDWVLPPYGANFIWHGGIVLAPTLITLPASLILGPVASYNLMVVSLLIAAAWVYYFFLSKVLSLSFLSSFSGGAFFGFNPAFVLKAHGHINMIGAYSWAAALGVVFYVYQTDQFSWKYGVTFCLCLWTTFWTSFVEFFMLGIALCLTVALLETLRLLSKDFALKRRIMFFAPSTIGALSFSLFLWADKSQSISSPLAESIHFKELFLFPRLSVFAPLGYPSTPEAWGAVFPVSVLALTAIGAYRWLTKHEHSIGAFLLLSAALLILILDPFHGPSTIIRSLPAGEGFRIFVRFYPFMLFFLLPAAALGLESLLCISQDVGQTGMTRDRVVAGRFWAAVFLLLAMFEFYPAGLNVSPIKIVDLSEETRKELDHTKYCLVVPFTTYYPIHDTYQISLDMPCVNFSRWDKQSLDTKVARERDFPLIYKDAQKVYPEKPDFRADGFWEQANALRVKYILFEDKRDLRDFLYPGDVIWESSREVLVKLNDTNRAKPIEK